MQTRNRQNRRKPTTARSATARVVGNDGEQNNIPANFVVFLFLAKIILVLVVFKFRGAGIILVRVVDDESSFSLLVRVLLDDDDDAHELSSTTVLLLLLLITLIFAVDCDTLLSFFFTGHEDEARTAPVRAALPVLLLLFLNDRSARTLFGPATVFVAIIIMTCRRRR